MLSNIAQHVILTITCIYRLINRNRNKMKQKKYKIQELIRVHRNYCVSLRNLIPSLYTRLWINFSKIKRIKPIKEIAVPQTSLTLTNLRTTKSHTDSVDRHFDFIWEKNKCREGKIFSVWKNWKLTSFYSHLQQGTCLFSEICSDPFYPESCVF